MNKTVHGCKTLLLCGLVLLLVGCGGKDDVVSRDDSAEYRNAVSLPPLKKKSVQTSTESIIPSVPTGQATTQRGSAEDQPALDQSGAPLTNDISDDGFASATAVTASSPSAENAASSIIGAQVIDTDDDTARLQIDGGFETAWNFVSANLKRSDITVHNRNQSAGRFAIGCSALGGAATVSKSGGWAIFRKKSVQQEYCALQLVSSKAKTTVRVLNRSGNETAATTARSVFARLLNN